MTGEPSVVTNIALLSQWLGHVEITAVKKLEETALRAIDNRKGYGDYLIVLVYRVSYLSLTVM